MNKWVEVSREEWLKFKKDHPELETAISSICEPPVIHLNDFSEGKIWPESMVARTWDDWLQPDLEKRSYQINSSWLK